MNMLRRLEEIFDYSLMARSLLFFSVALLFLIPMDAWKIRMRNYTVSPREVVETKEKGSSVFSIDSYKNAFMQSTLFGNVPAEVTSPLLRSSILDLVKDFRLKGVILAGEPEAIVEDARTQKTVFVKTGQQLGELTVKQIQEGVLIVAYLGEEVRLEIQ